MVALFVSLSPGLACGDKQKTKKLCQRPDMTFFNSSIRCNSISKIATFLISYIRIHSDRRHRDCSCNCKIHGSKIKHHIQTVHMFKHVYRKPNADIWYAMATTSDWIRRQTTSFQHESISLAVERMFGAIVITHARNHRILQTQHGNQDCRSACKIPVCFKWRLFRGDRLYRLYVATGAKPVARKQKVDITSHKLGFGDVCSQIPCCSLYAHEPTGGTDLSFASAY